MEPHHKLGEAARRSYWAIWILTLCLSPTTITRGRWSPVADKYAAAILKQLSSRRYA